ncbi:MAG TPA: hypothetical protein GXZ81_03855, partial [Fastidiosipila sp.]|nr:hypothetical protein [Fastidiosipila sp.]
IIGTVADLDPHLSHKRQVDTADVWYLTDYSAEKTLETRRELMSTEAEDLLNLSQVLAQAVENNAICIVGPADVFSDKDLSLIDIS